MLRLKLKELYKKNGVLQKEVSEATGIRPATLSGLANNMRTSWDVKLLDQLMHYFELNSIDELIEYVSTTETNKHTLKSKIVTKR